MNTSNLTLLLLSVCLFLGCNQDEISPITDSDFEINFELEHSNSPEDFTTRVENIIAHSKTSRWSFYDYVDQFSLIKEIEFDLNLENGVEVRFGIWFKKYEPNQEPLILEDENTLRFWGERDWDYLSTEIEKDNFYREFDEARITVNNTVIFHGQINDDFDVVKVDPVVVNGEEKSYITLNFSGKAYGWYDPLRQNSYYKISNGVFKGILE